MDGKKVYSIVINGVQESVDAVKALNQQLTQLETTIKNLSEKTVNVKVNGDTSSTSKSSSLSQDVALQKELNALKNEGTKLEAKQVAYQDESYQKVLAQKDILKEIVDDQKAIAAQERLQADMYSNTMAGMKQKLADLKSAINTTDLGDSDQIKKMTKEANELTNKLKEMEEAYGQFGRNVGNYQSAAEGFNKFKIQVGDTVREFNSAREASRQLKQELLALEDGAEGAQELRQAIQQVDSAIKDLNKSSQVMDNMLDTMESIVSVANVGQGIRGLFGVDDAEMQKSIKNLVALQNILKGIETINKQINTREGIGAWIAPFNTQIDVATTKLIKFNTSLLGTSKAAKVAAVSIKAFGKALKLALSAGILIVLDLVTEGVMKLIDSLKKGSEEAERTKKITEETSKAYGDAAAKISYYQTKVNSFNGTKRQEKRLVEELNSALGSQLGSYKTLAQWKDVLIKKGALYAQVLAKEAKVQALSAAQAEAMANLEKAKIERNGVERYKQERVVEALQSQIEKAIADLVKFQQDNKLGDFSDSIEKNTNKSADALNKEKEILTKLELSMMKDSLAKVLRQMEIDHEAEVKELGKNQKAIQASEKLYYTNRQKAIDDFFKNVNSIIAANQEKDKEAKIDFNLKETSAQIDELILKFNELNEARAKVSHLSTKDEFNEQLTKTSKENILYASEFNYLATKDQGEEYFAFLENYLSTKNKAIQDKINSENVKGSEEYYKTIEALFRNNYSNELSLLEEFKGDEKEVLKRYNHQTEEDLESSLTRKLQREEEFSEEVRNELAKNIIKRKELLKSEAEFEEEQALTNERNAYKALQEPLQAQKDALEQSLRDIKVTTDEDKKLYDSLNTSLEKVEKEIEQNLINHSNNMAMITAERERKIKGIVMNSAEEMSTLYEGYYRNNLETFSSTYNKIKDMVSETPVNSFDIVNIGKLSKNLKEAEKATKTAITRIKGQMVSLDINLAMGLIKPEVAQKTKAELEAIELMFKKMFGEIQQEQSNAIPKFVQSLTPYIQAAMDTFSTIMNAVWDAQDAAFDKEQEEIDKYNEKLQDALDKQQDIVQEHKDAINDIEDELSTARGDRRAELIDRLNAEIAAEKRAAKEKEKLEKEQEKLKIRQDELDKKRQEAEYNRQIIQAIVNGAMAVTMAAVNKWPAPAIPLMALAAATTAAQVAIMKQNKPYAKGGLLEGRSHAEGGIPVGNTGIEVEGKEYVIRKKSTTPNIDVLDYINKSERKLNLDDFINFYSSKTSNVRRVVASASPKSRFADGGTIPMLNDNYEFDDRLLNAFERYADRPYYVTVTDIENGMNDVKYIRTLAGIE